MAAADPRVDSPIRARAEATSSRLVQGFTRGRAGCGRDVEARGRGGRRTPRRYVRRR
jgi:hypothetical protein